MPDDWDNVAVLQRNRERMHAPLGAYPDWDSARTERRGESPFILSLNGTWRFFLADSPSSAPDGFAAPEFAGVAGWQDTLVPGNWQLDPASPDRPLYTNIVYPFDAAPPHPPKQNPTGCYRRVFTVPAGWHGRSVFLVIESADSACKVWVNGEEAGYSQDSRLPAEFEITRYLKPGENTLAVLVPRWCDGSYLEDQDFWHLSGLQRDVFLYAKPPVHLRDYVVRTTFPEGDFSTAQLFVAATLHPSDTLSAEKLAGYEIEATLYDADGAPMFDVPARAKVSAESPMYGENSFEERGSARLTRQIERPQLWSAESPYLYTLVLALIDSSGEAIDFESVRVGFRHVEIKDRVLRLNGERLVVRGVNRHEHNPYRGRAVNEQNMRADILAMKRLNFNAVRTSHYPDHPLWYDLCDELGLYVVDEANLETHGVGALLSKHLDWMHAYLERGARMAMRDRNHPSIIAWSLGNESSHGPHHAATAAWLRAFDPTRPVQYESGNPPPAVSDIMAPMYPRLAWVREVLADPAETRPIILCEYAYAKGNASGDFNTFWKLVNEAPSFQGGFIWDWSDKALAHALPSGETVWGYGGDLGGAIDYAAIGEDPSMVLNGVVAPDLTPHPGAWEIKNIQAPVAFAADATDLVAHCITVWNKHQFTDIAGMTLHWALTENGVPIDAGALQLPSIPPGRRVQVGVPYNLPDDRGVEPGTEYWLNVSCALVGPTPWADAGHVIAWMQFAVPFPLPAGASAALDPPAPTSQSLLNAREEDEGAMLVVAGASLALRFDLKQGRIAAFAVDGRPVLEQGPVEQFWRAPTDNDFAIFSPGNYLQRWKDAGIDQLQRDVRAVEWKVAESGRIEVTVHSVMRGADSREHWINCLTRYDIADSGEIYVDVGVIVSAAMPPLPRVGMEIVLPPGMARSVWYGRGPHESYPDRKSSALVGRFEAAIPDAYPHYIRPGEAGGREDVRWAQIDSGAGQGEEAAAGLLILGQPDMHLDVSRFSVADLTEARHYYELVPRPETYVHIDHRHMGLGGDDGWTPNVHPEFLIPPGSYHFGFYLTPAAADPDLAQQRWSAKNFRSRDHD